MANEMSKQMIEQFGHLAEVYAHLAPEDEEGVYVVHAEDKTEADIDFCVISHGYKQAWAEARRQLRLGHELLPVEPEFEEGASWPSNVLKVEPGAFKVRRVFKLTRKPAKQGPVTARELFERAEEQGIGFNKKLVELLDSMESERGLKEAEQESEAA